MLTLLPNCFRFDEAEAIAAVRFERSESMATTRFRLSEAAAQTRFNVLVAVALHIYRDIMRGLFLVCTCMFQHINLLQRILAEIPRSVPTLGATIFEDAHGCIVHISIDFIQSWDVRMPTPVQSRMESTYVLTLPTVLLLCPERQFQR